jgi:cytochrome subunit of sulfide dehydrogenase
VLRRLASALAALAMLPVAASAADAPPGASSCSGCHAPASSGVIIVPPISGRPAAETASLMREFKSGARPATVMGRIAKGFDDAEIDAIAQWLGAQGQQQGK